MDDIDVFERLMIELRYRALETRDVRERAALGLAATLLEMFVGIARQSKAVDQPH